MWQLLASADFWEVALLSLRVTGAATLLSTLLGLPLGAMLAVAAFPGRGAAVAVVNGLMGIPPVVAGLAVYLLLSKGGALGVFGLLYTPTAMVLAQILIITPIIASLTRQAVEIMWLEYKDELKAFKVPSVTAAAALLHECRWQLSTAVLAGFGRGIAEVGAVMIVGGNIDHYTRTLTTAIALETRKGNLETAIALGALLLLLAMVTSGMVGFFARGREA